MQTIASAYLPKQERLVFVSFGYGSMTYRPIFEPYVDKYIPVDLPGNIDAICFVAADGTTCLPDDSADVVLSTEQLPGGIAEDAQRVRRLASAQLPDDLAGRAADSIHGIGVAGGDHHFVGAARLDRVDVYRVEGLPSLQPAPGVAQHAAPPTPGLREGNVPA